MSACGSPPRCSTGRGDLLLRRCPGPNACRSEATMALVATSTAGRDRRGRGELNSAPRPQARQPEAPSRPPETRRPPPDLGVQVLREPGIVLDGGQPDACRRTPSSPPASHGRAMFCRRSPRTRRPRQIATSPRRSLAGSRRAAREGADPELTDGLRGSPGRGRSCSTRPGQSSTGPRPNVEVQGRNTGASAPGYGNVTS